ncbi:MAG: hypothetical protein MJ239_07080 [Bacilli bacterium]|nr:hypothetical protein [Bacilli bacterium]
MAPDAPFIKRGIEIGEKLVASIFAGGNRIDLPFISSAFKKNESSKAMK